MANDDGAFEARPSEAEHTDPPSDDHSAGNADAKCGAGGGGGDGNLFLTCLRLRFEERGCWSDALDEVDSFRQPGAQDDTDGDSDDLKVPEGQIQVSAQPSAVVCPTSSAGSSPMRQSPTWRERIGFRRRLETAAAEPRPSLRHHARNILWQQRAVRRMRSLRLGAGPPLGFGAVGPNVSLEAPSPGRSAVAARRPGAFGSDGGIACTSRPLLPEMPAGAGRRGRATSRRYFFEVQVPEVAKGTTESMSLGFAWSAGASGAAELASAKTARGLPLALVVGGDLPRAYCCGRVVGTEIGWRPILHVREGSVVGAVLEVSRCAALPDSEQAFRASLAVLQDGSKRAEVVMDLEPGSGDDAALLGVLSDPSLDPYGVVELCGNVRRVQLYSGPPHVHGQLLQARVGIGTEAPSPLGGGNAVSCF